MANSVLLLGSTDITLVVAEALRHCGIAVSALVSTGERFSISYSKEPVINSRSTDLEGWARRNDVRFMPFSTYQDIADACQPELPALCLVAGWHHLVPAHFRARFSHGCIGLHASLLPALRGGAPLNWAILSGLTETGVSIFDLTDGVDEGGIYGQRRFDIGPRATIGELVKASQAAAAALIGECVPAILEGRLQSRMQSGMPSYGLQRRPEDGLVDWTHSAESIDRLVRATGRPYPGAFTHLEDLEVRLWQTTPAPADIIIQGMPGQIFRLPGTDRIAVVSGNGVLLIEEASDASGNGVLDKLRASSHKRFDR